MLELKNVSFQVTDENDSTNKEILKDVSLKVDDRFVAITGPNGGGTVSYTHLRCIWWVCSCHRLS